MSGGHFNYNQFRITQIVDDIEEELEKQGEEIPEVERLSFDHHYYDKYPEEKYYPVYSEIVQQKMKEAVKYLRIAHIYAQRVDWYLSGDDNEESFLKRLEEDLENERRNNNIS